MGKRSDKFRSETLRARVRQMIEAGYSVARMVKETGQSAKHVARIVEQERAAIDRAMEGEDG